MTTTPSFIPSKGDYFYPSKKPYKVTRHNDSFTPFGMATEEKVAMQEDYSFRDEIFQCTGRDDHALTAKTLTGYCHTEKPTIFVIASWSFYPVGPEMLEAAGIQVHSDAAVKTGAMK